MPVLTTGVKPEDKHNLPNQLSGSRFPTTYAGTFVPGLGRLDGWGTTVPTDGDTGWAKAALFRHTDGSDGDDLIYQNNGDITSCAFIEITSVAGADFGATGLSADVIAESTTDAGVTVGGMAMTAEGLVVPAGKSIIHARNRCVFFDDFFHIAGTTESSPHGVAGVINIDGSGPPTMDYVNDAANGEYLFTTHSDSERQGCVIKPLGDQLLIDLTKNPILEVRLKISPAGANFTADERVGVGFAPAFATAEASMDNIDHSVFFRMEGANLKIFVEADDASTDTNDQDSTIVYAKGVYFTLRIDLSTLTAIGFYVDGVEQGGAAVSAAALTGNVVPVIVHQRDAGSEVNTVTIDYVYCEWDRA